MAGARRKGYIGAMRFLLAMALFLLGSLPAAAQIEPGPKVAPRLIAERAIVAPGERVPVALELVMKPGWHTYWINPGEAGAPTELKWKLARRAGRAAELEWPYPKRLPVGPLMDYGYEGKVWLLTAVQAPAAAKPGDTVTLEATGSWLVCREVCIPEDAHLTLALNVAEQGVTNPVTAEQFAAARAKLPQTSPWRATYRAADDKTLDLFLESPIAGRRPAHSGELLSAQRRHDQRLHAAKTRAGQKRHRVAHRAGPQIHLAQIPRDGAGASWRAGAHLRRWFDQGARHPRRTGRGARRELR